MDEYVKRYEAQKTFRKSMESYFVAILVRPRSHQYAHLSCMDGQIGFENRKRVIPSEDAEILGNCLLCGKPF